ncbi:unnamed protein product, partial [Brachionus calyciflorus]
MEETFESPLSESSIDFIQNHDLNEKESDHESDLEQNNKIFYSALLILFYSSGLSQNSFKIVCDFLKIINETKLSVQVPSNLDQTFSKLNLYSKSDLFTKEWLCNKCQKVFDNIENKLRNLCPDCGLKLQIDYKLCIESQLRTIFIANKLETFVYSNQTNEFIRDINDGMIYQDILEKEKSNFFTFLLNTDGISLSEKSRLSIWPIFLTINELPIEKRFCLQNVIVAGLSVSFGKPNMDNLLGLIKNDLLKLEYGFSINIDGYQNYKFFLMAAVFDKPARAAVLNVINSYGYFGCIKCYQKGQRLMLTK